MPDQPLTGDQIRALLLEVAEALPERAEPHMIVVAGGSLLAWHGLRGTTVDVDSVEAIGPELADAVAAVAYRHGLASRWLNDHARRFRPQSLATDDCEVLLDHPRLRVLGAPLRAVFLMKLFASRAADYDDLVRLWPRCGFISPGKAVTQMYAAYPAAAEDPHLVEYVTGIARAGGTNTGP
jgi:hypothetical protein